MLNFFDLVISALAVWRLAHMLKHEAGPLDVFIRIREKLGDSVFGRAMDCVACMSVWLAIIFFVPGTGTKYLLVILAISAMAMILESIYAMLRKESPSPLQDSSGVPGIRTGLQSNRKNDWPYL